MYTYLLTYSFTYQNNYIPVSMSVNIAYKWQLTWRHDNSAAVPPLITRRFMVYAVGQLSPCRTVQASVPVSQNCVGANPGLLRHCRTVPGSVPAYFSQPVENCGLGGYNIN